MKRKFDFDLICVGAGPYGISLYAHAIAAGLKVSMFGRLLSFWRENIPPNFILGTGVDTSVSVPYIGWEMRDYLKRHPSDPQGLFLVTREVFIDYCEELLDIIQPVIDQRRVVEIMPLNPGFEVLLDDESHLSVAAIAIATGHLSHRFTPDYIQTLPTDRWLHSADEHVLERVGQKRVVVVGGGLSAMEMAVLLSESGAAVTLVGRRDRTSGIVPYYGGLVEQWLGHSRRDPEWWRKLDNEEKDLIMSMIEDYNPMTAWLASRTSNLRLILDQSIAWVDPQPGDVLVHLASGVEVRCDYIVAATGFRPSVSNLNFLRRLKDEVGIATIEGAPLLDGACQSSVPGLYFCGLLASISLGPTMRLIAGTAITSPLITKSVGKLLAEIS